MVSSNRRISGKITHKESKALILAILGGLKRVKQVFVQLNADVLGQKSYIETWA